LLASGVIADADLGIGLLWKELEITEAVQLTVDAPVAPARVVACRFQDQSAYRRRGARPSRAAVRVGSPVSDQGGVPALQGVRGDDQAYLAELTAGGQPG